MGGPVKKNTLYDSYLVQLCTYMYHPYQHNQSICIIWQDQGVRVAVREDLGEVEKLYAEFNQVAELAI